ncbi:DUF1850 domain-containing protein [Devosia limi]|nr:hypothetical protein SAMN02745223_03171 [Devosia limi DSM 17137]
MLCIAAAGVVTALATTSFTLGWTHSVEQTWWQERWRIEDGHLTIVSASVKGSGAGIAIPEHAVWADGVWTYAPALPPLDSLNLAASGTTGAGWLLCGQDGQCLELGEEPDAPIKVWPARVCAGPPAG